MTAMCANGTDLGHTCRLCGKPLLSCWDDGPSISWHMNSADAKGCRYDVEVTTVSDTRGSREMRTAHQPAMIDGTHQEVCGPRKQNGHLPVLGKWQDI